MNNKIYLFIGISALVHLSVYSLSTKPINKLPIVEHGRSAISIEITQSKTASKKQTEVLTPMKPEATILAETTDTSLQKVDPVIKNVTYDSSINFEAAQEITPIKIEDTEFSESDRLEFSKSEDDIKDTPDDINAEAISAVLQKELSKYFYYPASAQRKNWEGLVVLSFTIMPDGVIKKIHINKSSGYDVLDDAAIEALAEVKKHEELALAVNGSSLERLLPVTYKLTD